MAAQRDGSGARLLSGTMSRVMEITTPPSTGTWFLLLSSTNLTTSASLTWERSETSRSSSGSRRVASCRQTRPI
jgi:hypothetical protein